MLPDPMGFSIEMDGDYFVAKDLAKDGKVVDKDEDREVLIERIFDTYPSSKLV